MQTMDLCIALFLDEKKSHVLCKNNNVLKIVNARLSNTALQKWDCLVDKPSPLVVTFKKQRSQIFRSYVHFGKQIITGMTNFQGR